jgi:hypothetical protein
MLVAGALGFMAAFVLPWVDDVTLGKLATSSAHGHGVAWVIIAPQLLAAVIGALSIKGSARWLTGPTIVLFLVAGFLALAARDGQAGAKVIGVESLLAMVSALALTIKPVRAVRTIGDELIGLS